MTIIRKIDLLLLAVAREFTVAEIKAVINLLIIPIALTVITTNIFGAIFYIALCVVIYTKVIKDTENARVFKNLAMCVGGGLLLLIVLGFGLIIA